MKYNKLLGAYQLSGQWWNWEQNMSQEGNSKEIEKAHKYILVFISNT